MNTFFTCHLSSKMLKQFSSLTKQGTKIMKFSLTIVDATAEEIAGFFNNIDKLREETSAPVTTTQAPPTEIPYKMPNVAPAEAPAPVTTTNDVKPVNTPEYDSAGVPWDESIHASTKTKKKDGTWTRKRGISDDEYNRGVAELKEMYPVPNIAPAATTEPVQQPAPSFTPRPGMASEAPVVNVPATFNNPAPAPMSVTQPPVQTFTKDFNGLINQLSDLFNKKEISANYYTRIVNAINEDFKAEGVSILSLDAIATNEELVNYAWECLRVDGYVS